MTGLKITSKQFYVDAIDQLRKSNTKANTFSLTAIDKISINVGVGKYKNDTKARSDIENYLKTITGQNPKIIESKLSIAGFKLRKGEPVGMLVTLRGQKMYDFLMNLIYIALPRSRDFKGVKSTSFDKSYQSYSLGIESSSIFPLIGFDSNVPFGMQINIVFKKASIQNKTLLENLHFPFKKN
jgi:large subunit ribosomal protein L5